MWGPSHCGASAPRDNELAGQRRQASRCDDRAESQLVHAQARHRRRQGRCRARRPGRALPEGCRLRRAHRGSTRRRRRAPGRRSLPSTPALASKKPPPGWATKRSSRAPLGAPSRKASASSVGLDRHEALALGPIDRLYAGARRHERPCRLQAGQYAHVVLRRRAAEHDADSAFRNRASAHARSRVVVGQVVLVKHGVARAEVGRNPSDGRRPVADIARPASRRPWLRRAALARWCGPRPAVAWLPPRRWPRNLRSLSLGPARARPCPA